VRDTKEDFFILLIAWRLDIPVLLEEYIEHCMCWILPVHEGHGGWAPYIGLDFVFMDNGG